MAHDELIASITARLDQAALAVMQSSATTAEQHAIVADITIVYGVLKFLGNAPADRVAAFTEAMVMGERIRVPKTAEVTVGWSASDLPPNDWSDVERRTFLALAATMTAAPMLQALAGLPDDELVPVLQRVTDRYREQLRATPSAVVYGGIVRHAEEIDRRAKLARKPARSQLLGVLAETAALAGTVAFMDLGRRGAAARHFAQATHAAKDAHDLDRLAWSYDRIALHLQYAGRPADALNMHQRAVRECIRKPASLLACTLAKEQAVNFALLGEEKQALVLLDEAYWTREHADPAEASPIWVDDSTRLEATAGYVRAVLGRPDAESTLQLARARAAGQDALQATILAAMAEDAAGKDEPERAAQLAGESLVLALMMDSVERKRRVLRPWRRLQRHQDVPAVRELGEQLRAAGLTA